MAGKQADIKVGVITNYDDKGIKSAETGLKGFSNSIKQADGFTGKFKAGVGSLSSSLSSFVSSPGGMLVAGGAIAAAGKFAFDAASKFSNLGVEIGKLADATGLSSEAASRWKEVAGDIGVESGTLESSIGKLNKTLGANPKLFEDAGIAIARTKDGAIDVNETFLNTVDALNGIESPAKKAELATKLLGKGWQSMAELIGQGSGKLKNSLQDVSDVKVFDDDKIEKARQFREATDNLKDVMEDFTLEVGQKATPALIGLSAALKMLPGVLGSILGPIGDLAKGIKNVAEEALNFLGVKLDLGLAASAEAGVRATESFASLETKAERLATGTDVLARAQDGLATSVAKTTTKTDRLKESIAGVDLAYQGLTGKLDEEEAWENVNVKMEEFGESTKHTAEEVRNQTRDIADYVIETDTIPAEKKTEILALLNQNKLDEAKALLLEVTKDRDIYLNLIARGSGDIIAKLGAVGARVSGGPVSAGKSYLVGEEGPEVVEMGGNGTVIPNDKLGGGGVTNNVYVTVSGVVGDKQAVVRWVHEGIKEGQRQLGLSSLAT